MIRAISRDSVVMSRSPIHVFVRSFFDNFVAALMMLIGLKRAFHHLHPTPVQFLTFLFGSLLTSFTFDFVSEGWPGELQPVGFASYLIPPFLWLVFGIFLTQRYGVWRLILTPAILWLAADIMVGLLQSGIQWAALSQWFPAVLSQWIPYVYPTLFVWPTAALMFLFGRQLAWAWWLRVLSVVIAVAVLFGWSTIFSDQRLWYAAEVVIPEKEPHITEEAAFYVQPLLLNRALAQIEEGTEGQTDWYFLGVGGAAYQSVFRREVESVQSLFDTRFTTNGHSLVLINDDDTTLSQPIATRTSISKALETIGQRMNKDEDVLFLFLTSHGSADGTFELSHQPLNIQSLTPAWLRAELDKAGIRWRVVVISSCFSGAYIPSLQTPSSLVITAAEATKTSFGCTDDADFTYFGRAFFDEAVRQEHSLVSAFHAAKQTIATREKEEGFTPSQPQLFMGGEMQKSLPEFEKALFPE